MQCASGNQLNTSVKSSDIWEEYLIGQLRKTDRDNVSTSVKDGRRIGEEKREEEEGEGGGSERERGGEKGGRIATSAKDTFV